MGTGSKIVASSSSGGGERKKGNIIPKRRERGTASGSQNLWTLLDNNQKLQKLEVREVCLIPALGLWGGS